MKYLVLSFKNAGWFPNNKRGSKDHTYEVYFDEKKNGFFVKRDNRKNIPSYVEPITIHHVSNMLHVLFGERPKPSLRKTPIPKVDDIFNIAKNSYLKIDNYQYSNNKGDNFPVTEIIKTKKSVHNSHVDDNFETWVRLRLFLGNDFEYVLSELKQILNDDDLLNKTLKETVVLIKKNILIENNSTIFKNKKLEELILFLKEKRKQPIVNLFVGYNFNKKGDVVEAKHAMGDGTYPNKLTLMGGIEKICRLSGEIIVPIENEFWIEKLNKSKGFAKILDGGLVTVKKYTNRINNNLLNSFTKISELTTEIN
jgi:hypothetical protein